jgi:hypothetical protein
MADIIESDTTIIDLNQALYDALSAYVDASVSIIFDLPATDNPPTEPTLSVFLYEIHEDLQMRTAQMRTPPNPSGSTTITIAPGAANVCCNYIITYWDIAQTQTSSPGSPGGAPDNTAIKVMNMVVNALINSRQLAEIPGAYTRMIPPKAELNSLGNFWQSLGNKPRLSLNVSVTVPVPLTDKNITVPTVQNTDAEVAQWPPVSQ